MAGAVTLEQVESLIPKDKDKAIGVLHGLVKKEVPSSTTGEEQIKIYEAAVIRLGKLLAETGQAEALEELITFVRPFLNHVSKAKAAKLVRQLVDTFLDMESKTGKEIPLCQSCVTWAKDENRIFLRQALEVRLVALYHESGRYQDALQLAAPLLKELKQLDDKQQLVEVQLLESRAYHSLSNLPKARAALTSGRTTANGIYCPPKLQSSLDLQSGILHAADEKDFKTAYSYFYEAFEGYDSVNSPKAIRPLKYMLLSKIMLGCADEVNQIVSGKLGLRYSGRDIEAMKSIANASKKRSLADFKQTLEEYKHELREDAIVRTHLDALQDTLLEENLCRIIEPFSRVQILHVAELIKLPLETVEKKLSQMILDKKFSGILDQGQGVLRVYEEGSKDETYENAIEIIHEMGKAVDQLYDKAKKLT